MAENTLVIKIEADDAAPASGFDGPGGDAPPRPRDREPAGPRRQRRTPQPGDDDFVGPVKPPPRPGDADFVGPVRPPREGEAGFVGPLPEPAGAKAVRFKDGMAPPKAAAAGEVGAGRMSVGAAEFAGAGATALAGTTLVMAAGMKAAADTALDFAKGVATATAVVGAAVARDNLPGLVTAAARATAGLAEKVPVIGETVGKWVDAVGTMTVATLGLADAFTQRGRELAKFSGPLSEAQARAQVAGITSDMAEAQVLGQSYANITNAQTDLLTEVKELLAPIKEIMMGVLTDVLKDIKDFLANNKDEIRAIAIILTQGFKAVVKALQLEFGQAFAAIRDIPGEIEKARQRGEDFRAARESAGNLAKVLFELADRLPSFAPSPDENARDAAKTLSVPLLGGLT